VTPVHRLATLLLAAAVVAAGTTSNVAAAGLNTKAPVPEVLKAAESSAEDVVDDALSGDRGSARATAATLSAAAAGPAAATLTRSGVPRAEVAQLRARANRLAQVTHSGSFIGIALAANAVSQLMTDLYARFQDRVPAPILALDYLDREVQLRSLAGQPAKAATALKALEPTWLRVRPKVLGAGGAEAAAAFDKHVAAMGRLDTAAPRKLQAEAARGLELVDELENVFTAS
jgi:hypothetical protein